MRAPLLVLLLAGLLALSCRLPAVAADADDPDTTVLTDDNFEGFIQNDLTLVEFYAPWCGHCKALTPEYAQAATTLKSEGILLGKMDATVHTKTPGSYSVRGYPTLKVFRNGKAFDYNGPRKADGIVAYMRKQTGPAAKPVASQSELDALLQRDPELGYVVLGLFSEGKQSQLQSSFQMLANRLRDEFLFGRSTAAQLKQAYGLAEDEEAVVAILHGEKTVYDGSSKTAELEAFIRQHSVPLVGEYSDATSRLYSNRNLPVAKLFLNVDRRPGSKTMTYYTNRLKKIANQFLGKISVVYADRKGQQSQLEHYNMQGEEHGFVVEDLAAQKQYKFEGDDEEEEAAGAGKKKGTKKGLDVEGWIAHIEDVLNGDATAYVRSQKAPKNNAKLPVKIATGSNFAELVSDDKDVLLEFYAPWCGHCKALEPKYEQLGKKVQKLAGSENVVVAKLDATANDFDRSKWSVSGYPTLFFKPAGGVASVYEGPREVDTMLAHIKKNAKTLKAGGKKKKGKKGKKKAKKTQ